MYGGIPEKKLTQKDMQLNCQNIREEFQKEIDTEHKRINVDSAKKKAVLYHHDYEGFRQMVLGANLYSLKSKELQNFETNSTEKIFNPIKQNTIIVDVNLEEFNNYIKDIQCKNFRDFRTLFQKNYINPINEESYVNCMNILQAQNPQNLKSIFSVDFHIDYFFQILDVFTYSLNILCDGKEIGFIVEFLFQLQQIKDFINQVKKFLKKSEKQILKEFVENLKVKINQQYSDVQLNPELILKFNDLQYI